MKIGDLVRVKRTMPGDGLEMRKLYHTRVPFLLIDIRINGFWTHVLDAGVRRAIPMQRLELVNENR